MSKKKKVSIDTNINVAILLYTSLLALGFNNANITRGNTTLIKVIS